MTNNYSIIPEGENFSPSLHVAGCFLEFDSKVLYIKRAPHISQGNIWCIPGGKLEINEEPITGVIREVFEEVGIGLSPEKITNIGKLQIRKLDIDYTFHIFVAQLHEKPSLALCFDECVDAQWLTVEEIKQLPLIVGGEYVLKCYQDWCLI